MEHQVEKITVPVTVDITKTFGWSFLFWLMLFFGAGAWGGYLLGAWSKATPPGLGPQVQQLTEEKVKLQADLDKSQQQVKQLESQLYQGQDWSVQEAQIMPRK